MVTHALSWLSLLVQAWCDQVPTKSSKSKKDKKGGKQGKQDKEDKEDKAEGKPEGNAEGAEQDDKANWEPEANESVGVSCLLSRAFIFFSPCVLPPVRLGCSYLFFLLVCPLDACVFHFCFSLSFVLSFFLLRISPCCGFPLPFSLAALCALCHCHVVSQYSCCLSSPQVQKVRLELNGVNISLSAVLLRVSTICSQTLTLETSEPTNQRLSLSFIRMPTSCRPCFCTKFVASLPHISALHRKPSQTRSPIPHFSLIPLFFFSRVSITHHSHSNLSHFFRIRKCTSQHAFLAHCIFNCLSHPILLVSASQPLPSVLRLKQSHVSEAVDVSRARLAFLFECSMTS